MSPEAPGSRSNVEKTWRGIALLVVLALLAALVLLAGSGLLALAPGAALAAPVGAPVRMGAAPGGSGWRDAGAALTLPACAAPAPAPRADVRVPAD